MQEQVKRLVADGRYAFFVPLEALDREVLEDIFSREEDNAVNRWKVDGGAPAWFLLDAVDELKLTTGKLDRALRHLSKSIDGHLDRARIVISCRPWDWRPALDVAIVQKRLPVPETKEVEQRVSSEERFLGPLRRDSPSSRPQGDEGKGSDSSKDALRTVALLPLDSTRIRQYVVQAGVADANAFLTEVERRDVWAFARRPLDLDDLIVTWTNSGRLGSRAEQHEANVTFKLRDDPERPDCGVLSEEDARRGAERLALALVLMRARTLQSPDQMLASVHSDGVLDPASVLPDWTEERKQVLLRRALFDPATYGRVRFHHRSVQEYLAACHLKTLRQSSAMSTKALFRMLFAERYGVEVVFPSMREIAAWLALWDADVLREVMKREPEVLLSLGDPESLNLEARRDLLRSFAREYGPGGWRGLNIPIGEVRRLAHPELASVVRELWDERPANPDVRELLMELIWQGPIEACADLARDVALAPGENSQRIAAIRALVACSERGTVREIAEDVLSRPDAWPSQIVFNIVEDLFPDIISVDELVRLMEQIPEPKRTAGGFDWVSRQIAKRLTPAEPQAITLRDKIADLIWRGRNSDQEHFDIRGRFDYLVPALADLCDRQIDANPTNIEPVLIRACVIASRFGDRNAGLHESVGKMKTHFTEGELRPIAFWEELAFMDQILPSEDLWERRFRAEHEGLVYGGEKVVHGSAVILAVRAEQNPSTG